MVRRVGEEIWTVLKVLQWTQQRFRERGMPSPRLDAELLLCEVLKRDRVGLYVHHDQPLAKTELAAYRELIKRRLAGEPVAYLLGRQEFWSLPFQVDRRVLIPRPETEGVVEVALELLKARRAPALADLCTGSGAIAIAVAHERPDARVVAVDLSADALAVAAANVTACEVDVELRQGDLLDPLEEERFDVITANPPYIAEGDYGGLPAEVRCEPRLALLGGPDGLGVIRRLLGAAPGALAEDGALVMEIGAGQSEAVAALGRAAGFGEVSVRKDLAGIERVVVLRQAP
jgi:release factor glutamine methyltransferase